MSVVGTRLSLGRLSGRGWLRSSSWLRLDSVEAHHNAPGCAAPPPTPISGACSGGWTQLPRERPTTGGCAQRCLGTEKGHTPRPRQPTPTPSALHREVLRTRLPRRVTPCDPHAMPPRAADGGGGRMGATACAAAPTTGCDLLRARSRGARGVPMGAWTNPTP